jgi:hypothetical protein
MVVAAVIVAALLTSRAVDRVDMAGLLRTDG